MNTLHPQFSGAQSFGGGAVGASPRHSRVSSSVSNGSKEMPQGIRRMSTKSRLALYGQTLAPAAMESSRMLANASSFTILTAVLTLFALFGDDFRLAITSGDADYYFDFITCLALTAFSIEIAVCSLGKEGYWMSFYFVLDVVTTVSLILDLTFVAQAIHEWVTSDEDGGTVRSASRASRVGSKAGRIVRVMRLLRIVKLYRHAMEARQVKLRKAKQALARVHDISSIDEESDYDESGELEQNSGGGEPESRVGKKLSELTTMRVIILVLVMLFVVPQLTFSNFKAEFMASSQYGADVVFRNWKQWFNEAAASNEDVLGNSANARPAIVHARRTYEKSLLQYSFFHNWQRTRNGVCTDDRNCPANYHMPLMWIGYRAPKDASTLLAGPELQSTAYECLTATNLEKVSAEFSGDEWLYDMGPFPQSVLRKMSSAWNLSCDCGTPCEGVNLMTSVDGGGNDYPCPQNTQMRLLSPGEKSGLRFSEIMKVTAMSASSADELTFGRFVYYFDQRSKVITEALLNIGQTLFVVLVLTLGALFFSKDANTLVLQPIERMIAKMEKIRDNPLAAMKLGDEEYRREEQLRKMGEHSQPKAVPFWMFWKTTKTPIKEPMETAILEKTIIKIGSLLALGFGEAGANIIGQNMKGSDSATVNAMIPGRKLDAIFGYCGIRHFGDATEILQDKVMLFVNHIGEIVHGVVDEYQGVPNKNIGEAFLLVWLLPTTAFDRRQRIADLSVLSYCRIVQGINESPVLAEYRGHPGLLQRIPNYRVELRFGFHYGWAIEGAIGSEYKIDASYLSPNVNMSSQLESATSKYSLFMLMSHHLYHVCSLPVCRRCRVVDRVIVRSTNVDIGIYTLDLDISGVEVVHPKAKKFIKNRYKVRQIREQMKNAKLSNDYSVEHFFSDVGINSMRRRFSTEFLKKFNMAYRNYEAGEWMVGKDMFESTQVMLGIEDGPSTALLAYMEGFGYVAPPTWSGFREFDDV